MPAQLNEIVSSLDDATKLQALAFLKANPDVAKNAAELMAQYQSGKLNLKDMRTQRSIFEVLGKLQDTGKIPELLRLIAAEAKAAGKLPKNLTDEKLEGFLYQFTNIIDAEVSARGLTTASKNVKYEDWVKLSHRLNQDVIDVLKPLEATKKVSFKEKEFIKIFENQTKSTFESGNELKLLVDGPASFKERERLIEGAKDKIHLLSWAFYDDATGEKFAKKLIEKSKEGVDVKIMVDGQVAMQPGHGAMLKLMEENGVQVIRWKSTDPLRRFDGQHRKIMIIDDEESISGGMNFGDAYSHLGPPETPKWRDTDLYIKGTASIESEKMFVKLWNEQVKARGVIDGKKHSLAKKPKVSKKKFEQSPTKVAIVNHTPGEGENILRANLLAINAAQKNITIENAYFILNPGIYRALLKAKARGVKIKVITNSAQSVDEPVVSIPILKSVNRLVKNGIDVYLKKGDTLHSKMMSVDGTYTWVGSYNYHPRSYRYEGEAIMSVLDEKFTKVVDGAMKKDMDEAIKVEKEIELPSNSLAEVGETLFYDQL